MSFAEKIAGLMARPNQDAIPRDDVPWYLKYAGRGLGIVGAFFAILFGLYNCLGIITLNYTCLISGILQMLAGFVVMAIEAPCCCMFIDYVQQLADKADQRPYWNRAALYCIIAIPPILLCFGLGSLFGSGLIFATGAVYGMMAIGKKGTREDMAAVASPTTMSPGQGPTSTDQHTTLMEDPDVWRPT
ncbi:unnamed protein product [Hermetia illucens]|uniref:Calcium channel flower n=1 Tax=Hermetia illucens TaxID=343691 RepID=A0A7R8UK25_HERIL|nr:calcium channel flower isoform X2 [Hermetia illucens]CAD7081442.1 unnamed protein product [Hermetia illucens]